MTDIATLGLRVDSRQLAQGTQALDRLGDQATMTERQTTQATTRMTRGFAASGAAAAGMSRSFSLGGNSTRMLSMQLSQVAQQAAAGGGFLRALAIQLPDIGLAFGTIGIAAGVAAGALLPLIGNLINLESEARDFESVMDQLDAVMGGIESTTSILEMSVRELSEEYGTAATRVRQFALAAAELRVEQLNDNLRDQVQILGQATESFRQFEGTAFSSGTMLSTAIGNIASQFQVTREEARQLAGLFRELDEAATFAEQQSTLEQMNASFREMGVEASNIPPELREALLQAVELSNEADRAAKAAEDLAALAGSIDFTTGAVTAGAMAGNLLAALSAQNALRAGRINPGRSAGPGGRLVGSGSDPGNLTGFDTSEAEAFLRGVSGSAGGGRSDAQEITAEMRAADQAIRQAQEAAVQFGDVQAVLNERLASGAIDLTTYNAALEQARERFTEVSGAQEFWQQQQEVLKNGILDAIVAGDSLADTFRNLAQAIARAALEAALFGTGPFAQQGGGGGLLGSLFGGLFGGGVPGKASGGPVMPGQVYEVGERGRELFAPTVPGRIIPNHMAGGSGGVQVMVSVDARGAEIGAADRIARQVRAMIPEIAAATQAKSANDRSRGRVA
ncbi:hypothetical protein P6F26_16850 [Roseibacterium sp. SDUM158017]|uniref:hypothetical protein n=1 Tax=Roseicyclus salinarum TaxID=3036773 RepID=UPI0024156C45|nr:hypothetical protein [Roseibacterium sp. SDUM158017]MDG4650119.1 hypothetical protein [Roseibacterium sp. SDUM158017]